MPQPLGLLLVPRKRFRHIGLSKWPDDERRHLLQPLDDPGTDLRPGSSVTGVGLQIGEALVEHGLLLVAHREAVRVGVRRDAIPDVLNELQALGDREPTIVNCGVRGRTLYGRKAADGGMARGAGWDTPNPGMRGRGSARMPAT